MCSHGNRTLHMYFESKFRSQLTLWLLRDTPDDFMSGNLMPVVSGVSCKNGYHDIYIYNRFIVRFPIGLGIHFITVPPQEY